MLGDTSPRLKPLLLPQLVEERKQQLQQQEFIYPAQIQSTPQLPPQVQLQQQQQSQAQLDVLPPWPYALATTNSSSSDVTSPLTPTFSNRGHARYSSSSSSLDLPPLPPLQDVSTSPPTPLASIAATSSASKGSTLRQLPDVEEEPTERESFDSAQDFSLYSCLCDEPCQHRLSTTDDFFAGAVVSDFDIDDYDIGFLSDGDFTTDLQLKKKRSGTMSPLSDLTTRLSSRFPTIQRWRSGHRSRISNGATDLSFENVLSRAPSSRSSSISAANRFALDRSVPPTPSLPQFGSDENVSTISSAAIATPGSEWPFEIEDRASIERDRAMATTPLLPPLMTSPIAAAPPIESPLQSPTVQPTPTFTPEIQSPVITRPVSLVRPSLSTRPSMVSLHQTSKSTELPPLAFPGLPEYDEWSDRLGHANFTITPAPYELTTFTPDTVTKFAEDWDLARVNYTKHLVRTGENYGQTSNIYALTEAKWAEIEGQWKMHYEEMLHQTQPQSAPMSKAASRSRSRGRGGRGRSVSAVTFTKMQQQQQLSQPIEGDLFAGMEWRRLEECLPSAVPQMLEALDADGKFPMRGDEDIVGPMQRDAFMIGSCADDRRPRFWRNLVGKVGLGR
ncbi:hypothetical protein VHEMI08166 [[Torrubiella] hemipterigena]|uniref:Only prolin and serin are matching in the corresponding protein n=1 Tax=[Torrubiella] hemipterigena TaxID=1531966 RepID=A0A0A1TP70_9HYPO|nr:hypothetical protein VHEMI08166 [[Torrubiella] hemipterigena]